MFGIILGAITIGSMLVGGTVNAISQNQSRKAQRAALRANISAGKLDLENLQDRYSLSFESYKDSQEMLNSSIYAAIVDRAVGSSANAYAGVLSNKNAYAELSAMYAEESSAEGSMNQAQAISGFKQTGTLERIAQAQSEQYKKAISLAEDSTRLSIMNTYINAGSQRQEQDYTIKSYQSQYLNNIRQWEIDSADMQNQMYDLAQQLDSWQGELDAIPGDSFWTITRDFLGGMV